MSDQEKLCWLWLSLVLGPAAPHSTALMEMYTSAAAIFDARLSEDFSPYLNPAQTERLQKMNLESCLPLWARCQRAGTRILPFKGEGYPERLTLIPDAPAVLFATGRPEALQARPAVSIVGSRRPSTYGIQAADALARTLAEAGVALVSGLADGLDSEAHQAAVAEGSPTAGFLGCSIDMTYPASHRPLRARMEQVGAVFSEYGPGEGGNAASFLQRNRLIAADCDLLCVVEARHKSGTMSTVNHALRYGRTVFAVPGDIFSPQSEGTNELIAQGRAQPVVHPETLLEYLGLESGTKKADPSHSARQTEQSGTEKQLMKQLKKGPCTLSQLCEGAKLAPGDALVCLTQLEMEGLVHSAGGLYACR